MSGNTKFGDLKVSTKEVKRKQISLHPDAPLENSRLTRKMSYTEVLNQVKIEKSKLKLN